jgi:hypothetical protein
VLCPKLLRRCVVVSGEVKVAVSIQGHSQGRRALQGKRVAVLGCGSLQVAKVASFGGVHDWLGRVLALEV